MANIVDPVDKCTGQYEQYREEMDRLTRMLVSYCHSQKSLLDSKSLEVDALNDKMESLEAEVRTVQDEALWDRAEANEAKRIPLEIELSRVYDDYYDARSIFRNTETDYVKHAHYLDIVETLQWHEKYLAKFTQMHPYEMWNNIKTGCGDFHSDYSEHPFNESDETIALEYFGEYLDSLVSQCTYHSLKNGIHSSEIRAED